MEKKRKTVPYHKKPVDLSIENENVVTKVVDVLGKFLSLLKK